MLDGHASELKYVSRRMKGCTTTVTAATTATAARTATATTVTTIATATTTTTTTTLLRHNGSMFKYGSRILRLIYDTIHVEMHFQYTWKCIFFRQPHKLSVPLKFGKAVCRRK
jgi:hypothetical protein